VPSLRAGLKRLGVSDAVVRATYRPEITTQANALAEAGRAERCAKGLNVPSQSLRIADLSERVAGYLRGGALPPTGQALADLMVALSARPGEVKTLTVVPGGKVVGAL
jgi:hypothetical protein